MIHFPVLEVCTADRGRSRSCEVWKGQPSSTLRGPEAVVPLMERFLKAAAGLAGSHVLLGSVNSVVR